MTKDTQHGKSTSGLRTTRDDQPSDQSQSQVPASTRLQRSKAYARSVVHKGTHDTLASFVKAGLIALAALVASYIGYHYFGHHIDLRGWLAGKPIIIETGSIRKAPGLEPDVVKKEVECRVKREREIERIIERRKVAWSVHERCKTEWKPSWNDKRTADEVCAPNLVPYRQLVQEVKDRQTRDECASVGVK